MSLCVLYARHAPTAPHGMCNPRCACVRALAFPHSPPRRPACVVWGYAHAACVASCPAAALFLSPAVSVDKPLPDDAWAPEKLEAIVLPDVRDTFSTTERHFDDARTQFDAAALEVEKAVRAYMRVPAAEVPREAIADLIEVAAMWQEHTAAEETRLLENVDLSLLAEEVADYLPAIEDGEVDSEAAPAGGAGGGGGGGGDDDSDYDSVC